MHLTCCLCVSETIDKDCISDGISCISFYKIDAEFYSEYLINFYFRIRGDDNTYSCKEIIDFVKDAKTKSYLMTNEKRWCFLHVVLSFKRMMIQLQTCHIIV